MAVVVVVLVICGKDGLWWWGGGVWARKGGICEKLVGIWSKWGVSFAFLFA